MPLATYPRATRATHNRPEGRSALLFGLAPGGVYPAAAVATGAVRSYRTFSPLPGLPGGIFSVALSVGSRPPGVTWHPALRSPDFPRCRGAHPRHRDRHRPRGALLPHLFTLTRIVGLSTGSTRAVCFLWHFPSARAGLALPTTVPCPVRTFLTPERTAPGSRAGAPATRPDTPHPEARSPSPASPR